MDKSNDHVLFVNLKNSVQRPKSPMALDSFTSYTQKVLNEQRKHPMGTVRAASESPPPSAGRRPSYLGLTCLSL